MSIKSMTGFGRSEVSDQQYKFTVEMKSVNHRYLDINMRMPKKLGFFESAIRNQLKNYMQRGKVDLFISFEDFSETNVSLRYNGEIAKEYMKYLNRMAEEFSLENDVRVSGLSRYPEVLVMEEQDVDEKEIWALLEKAIDEAAVQFVESRTLEGENLKRDLFEKLDGILDLVSFIETRSPEVLNEYRVRLEEKVRELLGDTQMEESRIATELVIFADKMCVDEETVRLRSHVENMKKVLEDGMGIGRKLDFIAQEMNREANTILSKANDLEVSNAGIDLKTEIEKVREQIQNIE